MSLAMTTFSTCDDDRATVAHLTHCAPPPPCPTSAGYRFQNQHLSISRVRLYAQCPRAFFYRYVVGLPPSEGGASAARFGVVLHGCHERVTRWVLDTEHVGVVPESVVRESYRDAWTEDGSAMSPELYGEGMEIMLRYYRSPVDSWAIRDVEKEFTFQVGRFPVTGFIDRVESPAPGVVEVVDLKSNRLLYDETDLSRDLQACVYAAVARTIYPDAKEVRFRFDMLRFGMSQRHREITDALVSDSLDYIQAIGEATETERSPHAYPPRLNANCAYCDYAYACESYQQALAGTSLEKRRLNVLSDEDLLGERVRMHAVAKGASQRKEEIDKILKAKIKLDGEVAGGGYVARLIPSTETEVDDERLRSYLDRYDIQIPGLFSPQIGKLREWLDGSEDEIVKAEIRSTMTEKPGTPRIDVRSLLKR